MAYVTIIISSTYLLILVLVTEIMVDYAYSKFSLYAALMHIIIFCIVYCQMLLYYFCGGPLPKFKRTTFGPQAWVWPALT